MFVLDTDTVTHLSHRHPAVLRHVKEVGESAVAITVVTRIEMLQGRFAALLKAATGAELLKAQGLLNATERLAQALPVLPFSPKAAALFESMLQTKGLKRRVVDRTDLLTASIVLAIDADLVTCNTKHFKPIPGLRVTNWLK